MPARPYRGRLAPSPTGLLHLGHAATFWTAQERARLHDGSLVLRIEDLDHERCKPEYADALIEDMRWYGLRWQEGPDVGGPCAPYSQSDRMDSYRESWHRLAESGAIYPCRCTRRDASRSLSAPHDGDPSAPRRDPCRPTQPCPSPASVVTGVNWRFRVDDEQVVEFVDVNQGSQRFVAGRDFGDFIIWRKDGIPAYQLAVVIDDAAMRISEVVRGADLLPSTAQQILLYLALNWQPPAFFHCPLVTDSHGTRLAKRSGAHSLRALRLAGANPEALRTSL